MRKHYKIISSIACIVLCIAIVVFGVYAASTSLVRLDASVSFTPSNAKLTIFAGMAGSKECDTEEAQSTEYSYYATNYGSNHVNVESEDDGNGAATFKSWTYSSATFDDDYSESIQTHPNPIYFFVQITNHVEKDIKITVDFTSNYTENNMKVSCLYTLQSNDYMKTNKSNIDNMYAIDRTSAPIQNTTNAFLDKSYTTLASDIQYSTGTEVDFSLNNATTKTSLSTLMIVIKLEVNEAYISIDKENAVFNFTISATNEAANN